MIVAKTIHPFPARMAPDLALQSLKALPEGSVVLDPMAGSGLVLRQAAALGHRAIGYDLDPLAVLMARVWNTPVRSEDIEEELDRILEDAAEVDLRSARLPWIHGDEETEKFIDYWFAPKQRQALTRLSRAIADRAAESLTPRQRVALDVLRIGLSRIVVTKEPRASLARDTSHSRPHRVALESEYDVIEGFERSVIEVAHRLQETPPERGARIFLGDARRLRLRKQTVDAVLTSPPYLNAIDYMRGHRLSLVWLGHSISDLRRIRSSTIGAERASDATKKPKEIAKIVEGMCGDVTLDGRFGAMVERYALDLFGFMAQISRVLKTNGRATLVVGNSSVNALFVRNSQGIAIAGKLAGLTLTGSKERDLPDGSRYLPLTSKGALSKRMRTETVLSFRKLDTPPRINYFP